MVDCVYCYRLLAAQFLKSNLPAHPRCENKCRRRLDAGLCIRCGVKHVDLAKNLSCVDCGNGSFNGYTKRILL